MKRLLLALGLVGTLATLAWTQNITRGTSPALNMAINTEQFGAGLRPILQGWYNGESGALNSPTTSYSIGHAYSLDSVHWFRDALNPVLIKGAGGTFDSSMVVDPYAVYVDNDVYLYYAGYNGTHFQIGVAISKDGGATFTKYASNPIITLGAAGSADETLANFPAVLYDTVEANAAKRFKMWYGCAPADTIERICYAYSANGLSWTKVGKVLDLGTAGQWDDGILQPGMVRRDGDAFYLYYGGNHTVAGRTQFQTGLATTTAPETTYTRSASNPLVAAQTTHVGVLTANMTIGTTTVTVADTSVFTAGEPVNISDDNNTRIQLTTVASITDATHLVVTDAAIEAFTTAQNAAIRSAYSWSVTPRALFQVGTTWVMPITGFQVFSDKGGGTAFYGERTGWVTAPSATGPWTYDYTRGIAFTPAERVTSQWDQISAENMTVLPARTAPGVNLASYIAGTATSTVLNHRATPTGITAITATGLVSTTAASATVTGSGSRFTLEVAPGDELTVNGETKIVSAVASNTSLTTTATFTGTNTSVAGTITPYLLNVTNAAGTSQLRVNSTTIALGGSLATPLPIASGGTGAATAGAYTVFANPTGASAAPAFLANVFPVSLYKSVVSTGSTGGGGSTLVDSYTLPGSATGVMATNGEMLDVFLSVKHAANTNSTTLQANMLGTNLSGNTVTVSGGIAGGQWRIIRTSSSTATVFGFSHSSAGFVQDRVEATGIDWTSSSANILKYSVNAPTSTNDLVGNSMRVIWFP